MWLAACGRPAQDHREYTDMAHKETGHPALVAIRNAPAGSPLMPRYVDVLGDPAERPAGTPVQWRASSYPVAVRDGRLLLVEPAWARRWELPGGGVELEREETLIEAAIRECREETRYRFVRMHVLIHA